MTEFSHHNNNATATTPTPAQSLAPWGWDAHWSDIWQSLTAEQPDLAAHGCVPARVVEHQHHFYECVFADAVSAEHTAAVVQVTAHVSGRFEHQAASATAYPTVGDWVALRPVAARATENGARSAVPATAGPESCAGRIEAVLPRRTAVSRHVAGRVTTEQVIAANVDILLIVLALDGGRNFVVRLLERALALAWGSGARPVIVLNKADCAEAADRDHAVEAAAAVAFGTPVVLTSARTGEGVDRLLQVLTAGAGHTVTNTAGGEANVADAVYAGASPVHRTVGMIGKSGVGKSALVNALWSGRPSVTGPAVEGASRADDRRGRHTTTHKAMYRLPNGAIVVDVPGLREIQLWGDGDDLAATFPDIAALAAQCRFGDCRHQKEPGCAVQAAFAAGDLPTDRYQGYVKLQRELAYLEQKQAGRAQIEARAQGKKRAKAIRALSTHKR